MATLRKRVSTTLRQLTLSSVALPASRFPCREVNADWVTHAEGLPFGFARLFLAAAHGGSFGKTSQTSSTSIKDETSSRFCAALKNAGIRSHGECLTLSFSESPSGAVECSLSDIIETGDERPQRYLSREQIAKMLRRLEKYGQENDLTSALSKALSDGTETKLQSTD